MEINFENVSYTYQKNTPFSFQALNQINLTIHSGEFVAIVGHTGSGKSTLLQHMNGLLIPTEGTVTIGDYQLSSHGKKQDLKGLRERVGIVFQYPEHQLFEETVRKDIAFGPQNFGVPEEEIMIRTNRVMTDVGLDLSILEKSPFELSGGQMRRVAIASVLAVQPSVLVLDEPTVGLDPYGQKQMMDLFAHMHKERSLTTVLVTHKMEDAWKYADRIIVLEQGEKVLEGSPTEIFQNRETLHKNHLELPEMLLFIDRLNQKLKRKIVYSGQSIDELAIEVVQQLKDERK
ncbi:energy-coupling factor transporter ATPase [Gracilibacillus marinus]|uniref:Energy-coupling factor transporter ATP-binding protein EcfA2 n=1 Tax=Gracilibacillus marinus TaxID=630535 RepID=A0ABV8VZA7_9BACI